MNAVDLALVLALDASASVNYDEFGAMVGGLAAALRDEHVIAGLVGGPAKASLAAVLLWSGKNAQAVLTEWTLIDSPAAASGFAESIENAPRIVPAGATAIGQALVASLRLLAQAPAAAARRVVDVAGDGRSNDGSRPGPVRDEMAAAGITINGLCILHEEPDLLQSYAAEVIGGPGAFALTCPDYPAFAAAMKRKLTREAYDKPVA